jgi:outer membrane protein OmpA-like peptidoglycan-associated protein
MQTRCVFSSLAALLACATGPTLPPFQQPVGRTVLLPRESAIVAHVPRVGHQLDPTPRTTPSGPKPSSAARLCDFSTPRKLFFSTGDTSMRPRGKQILEDLLACRQAGLLPDGEVSISGYADPRGSADQNRALALERAHTVENYLVRRGMPRDRISPVSLGDTEHEGTGPEDWIFDRRVEICILPHADDRAHTSAASSSAVGLEGEVDRQRRGGNVETARHGP